MRPPPLNVMAANHRTAEMFVVTELRDTARRLNYLDRPEKLYGRPGMVIIVHPTAVEHRDYREMMEVAKGIGALFLCADDTYARRHYDRQQELERLLRYPSPVATLQNNLFNVKIS